MCRRHSLAAGGLPSLPAPTLSQMRTEGLLDTAMAGACIGAALNSARRGVRGVVPGAVTVSLAISGVQYVTNSLHIARLQYLAAQKRDAAVAVTPSTDHEHPPSLISETSSPPPRISSSLSLFDTLKSFSPVKRLTSEEFTALKERGRKENEEKKKGSPGRPNPEG